MGQYEDRFRDGSREFLDPTPVSVPANFRRPQSLIEQMRSMIRNEVSAVAQLKGRESFEEAMDFDVGDDQDDPTTPWEHAADGEEEVRQALRAAGHAREARKAGWKPPPGTPEWAEWATQEGWEPSTQEFTSAPSAGANNGGNPTLPSEASRHSPST